MSNLTLDNCQNATKGLKRLLEKASVPTDLAGYNANAILENLAILSVSELEALITLLVMALADKADD